MEYLTPEDPKPGRSICCLKFTRKTLRGDRLCQPVVTQLKNIGIYWFSPSAVRWKPSITHQRYYRLLEGNGKFSHSRKYHPCYHGCNFPLHEHSPRWRNCCMQKNMGTTNSSRTSDRMITGDAYTGSKKQQFYFSRKPLSSNKLDRYGNQNGTLLCQHFQGGPRRTITPLVTEITSFMVTIYRWRWHEVDR